MELQQVVDRRRMVRRYSTEPVPAAAVDRMLANAVRAPSAGFSQGWAFLVLDTADSVSRFWDAATPVGAAATPDRWLRGMRTAPVVIVPFSSEQAYRNRYAEPDKGATPPEDQAWPVPYWHVDAGMAALLILQTAVDEGLGACFFGVPAERVDALRGAFDVPATWAPVGAITVGHPLSVPADGPARGRPVRPRRPRRPAAEVVRRGRWEQ